MLGLQPWIWLAAVASLAVALFVAIRMQQRTWLYRILLTLGGLALIWGVMPIVGGGSISPYLVVGAIAAFGFLVLAESIGDTAGW